MACAIAARRKAVVVTGRSTPARGAVAPARLAAETTTVVTCAGTEAGVVTAARMVRARTRASRLLHRAR